MLHRSSTAFLACIFAFAALAPAQAPDLVVTADTEGMYEIKGTEIEKLYDPRSMDLERVTLLRGDTPLPIAFLNVRNGELSRASSIVFYNPPRGAGPSRTHAYRLTHAASPVRIREVAAADEPMPA